MTSVLAVLLLAFPAGAAAPRLGPIPRSAGVGARTTKSVEAVPDAGALREALKDVPKVRVLFAPANGYGHQVSTLKLVERLRDFYDGEIEAFYDGRQTAEKLGVLLPGFDPSRTAPQRVGGRLNMTLERAEDITSRDREPVKLALTGGADKAGAEMTFLLHADAFLRLGPLDWSDYDDAVFRRGKPLPEFLEGSKSAPLLYRPATREQALAAAKSEGLKALLTTPAAVLPAYGFHPKFTTGGDLHRLLLAAAAAAPAGVVVPLLQDAPETVAEAEALARTSPLRGRLRVASLEDPSAARPRAGEVVLMTAGPVPPAVFEGLFARADLPPTLQGRNAANLAGLLGIPFIPIPLPHRSDALSAALRAAPRTPAFSEALARAQEDLRLMRLAVSGKAGAEHLTRYMLEAARPGSGVRRLFEAARLREDDHASDKLLRGLMRVFFPPKRPA